MTQSLLPIILGIAVVLQGVVNRRIGNAWGLNGAILLNAFVLLCLALCFALIARSQGITIPEFFRTPTAPDQFKIWFLLAGICGFTIIVGVPWSFTMNGAGRTFVIMVATQIAISFLFDHFFGGESLNLRKILGASLAIIGAVIAGWK